MKSLRERYQFNRIIIVNADCSVMLLVPEGQDILGPNDKKLIGEAMETKRLIFSDIYSCKIAKATRLSIVAPDSTWIVISKVDEEEVYAPIRKLFWIIVALGGVLIIAAGAGIGFIWRHHPAQFYRKQYESELENLALIWHFKYLPSMPIISFLCRTKMEI